MIEGLKPYAEYKESGSRWIGSVPSNWTVRNLRTLISSRSERNRPDLPLLSVAREKGVFVRSLTDANENHNVIPEDLTNYKVARAGNLVINKMKAWQGSMGIAPCDGIVSPAYFVFEFCIANRAFGQALLRSKPYVAHFGQASDGVRIGQWDLSIPGMRQIPVLVPSEDEQAAIVRFLDHKNRKIDRFIHTKRRLVELLNEKKKFIINHAVTKGLDPDVSMKDSGMELMGEVPQHWGVTDIKRLCLKVTDGSHFSPPTQDTGLPYITVKDVKERSIDFENCSRISEVEYLKLKKNGCQPRIGDVLLTKDGTIGKAVVVNEDKDFVILSSLGLITPNQSKIISEYLRYYLISGINVDQMFSFIQGSALTRLTITLINQLLIVYPPIPEQRTIVSFLDHETAKLDALIAITRHEIDLVREFRTRLISDIVTGKVDVRCVELTTMDEAEGLENIEIGEETESEELIESEEVADADN